VITVLICEKKTAIEFAKRCYKTMLSCKRLIF